MTNENTKQKKSVYQILSETIINLLDSDNGEYQNPFWLERPDIAVNAKSGRQYSGINKFMLSPVVRKYNDNRFLTFNEITQMGGSIKKDEKGHIVYFSTKKEDNSDDYLNIVQNIMRNFNDMKMMRDKVVDKTRCKPLPQMKLQPNPQAENNCYPH